MKRLPLSALVALVLTPSGPSWAQPAASASAPAALPAASAAPPPGLPSAEASTNRLRLAELLVQLRSQHPALAAQRARLRGSRAAALAAGLWTNPVLDASHMVALRRSSYDRIGAPVVGLTQFLELSGAPGARRRAAELDADATAADAQAIERDLVAGLTLAFHAYAEAIERQKAQQAYTRELERVEQFIKTRVEGGMAPRYDATRMALALVEARSAILAARADTRRAHGALAIAVGSSIPPEGTETDVDFEATIEIASPGGPGEPAPSNPYLLAVRRRTEAASAAVVAAEKSVWPGLGLRLAGGFGQAPGQVDLGLGVIVPLPVLDRGQGTIQAVQARAEEARAEQSVVERSLRQQIAAAQEELERRVKALEEFRRGSQALLAPLREQAEAGYKDGRLSAFELIEAYRSARDARLRQVELVVGALGARVSLQRLAAGQEQVGP